MCVMGVFSPFVKAVSVVPERLRVGAHSGYQAARQLLVTPYVDRRFQLIEAAKKAEKIDKETIAVLSAKILRVRELIHVDPHKHRDILAQLMHNEGVHPVNNEEDLVQKRLGGPQDNKDCQAIVVPTSKGLGVLGQIFRFHAHVEQDQEGLIFPDTLPTNLDVIKTSDIENREGNENVTCYWTISSGIGGSGPLLISDIAEAAQGRFETTVSPAHEFRNLCGIQAMQKSDFSFKAPSDLRGVPIDIQREVIKRGVDYIQSMHIKQGLEQVQRSVMEHLNSTVFSPDKRIGSVGKFHLGNGASVIGIGCHESERDPIAINLGYDRSQLDENKRIFGLGSQQIPVGAALHAQTGIGYVVYPKGLSPRRFHA